jgi:hypothetical protein
MTDEYFSIRIIERVTRRARVPHVCICSKPIPVGERYEREFSITEGEPVVILSGWHIHRGEES